jgi:hypothetical protein
MANRTPRKPVITTLLQVVTSYWALQPNPEIRWH